MLFTKSPIKPATSINSNVWYHVTEGRVDRPGRKFGSMLQVDKSTDGLKVFPITKPPYYWQFQPVNSSSSSSSEGSSSPALYVVRNSLDGAAKQLSACRNETEPAEGQTGLCMAPANGADDAQVWRIDQWGGSGDMARDGLRLINAANGTSLWLDVHSGNPPFMNSSVRADDADADGEPSQHWYMTSAQAVNAIEYSTIQTIDPSSTDATAATASTTAGAEATASTSSSPDGTSGLSTGAQAGIGIGVGLAVIALAVAALFLWRRRKTQGRHPAGASQSLPPMGSSSSDKKFHPLPSELPDGDTTDSPRNAAFDFPQELPATAARSSSQVAHEAQTQRYELDSTPVALR